MSIKAYKKWRPKKRSNKFAGIVKKVYKGGKKGVGIAKTLGKLYGAAKMVGAFVK